MAHFVYIKKKYWLAGKKNICIIINMGELDVIQLMECVDFAAIKHRNQRRMDSDSTPYINHPIGIY